MWNGYSNSWFSIELFDLNWVESKIWNLALQLIFGGNFEFEFSFFRSKVDYYALATTIYTMLMGIHCKIVYQDGQWKLPTLKRYFVFLCNFPKKLKNFHFQLIFDGNRGHHPVWRQVTTSLLNSGQQQLDLGQLAGELAVQMAASVKPREMTDKMRELERYLASVLRHWYFKMCFLMPADRLAAKKRRIFIIFSYFGLFLSVFSFLIRKWRPIFPALSLFHKKIR